MKVRSIIQLLKRNAVLRKILASLAIICYGNPARSLQLIGITGTVGKTTTAFMVKNILEAASIKTGLISTAGYFAGGEEIPLPDSWLQKLRRQLLHKTVSPATTPDPFVLHNLLRTMKNKGVKVVVMEVSSFGLMYWRTYGLHFAVAVLTNISFNHHIAIHGGMDNYINCKKRLFSSLPSSALAVLPQESEYFSQFADATKAPISSYGLNSDADIWGQEESTSQQGSKITIHEANRSYPLDLALPARFNIYNALAAISALDKFSFSPAVIREGLENMSCIPGRWEIINGNQYFTVVVDKANTPAAFQGIIDFVRRGDFRKKIAVYGNFGESPLKERNKLAELALNFFDFTIITEDDPQKEDPQKGIQDFLNFASQNDFSSQTYKAVPQRRKAIKKAVQMAGAGDIILILGRGNEKMMDYGNRVVPFDDRKVAKEVLKEEGY